VLNGFGTLQLEDNIIFVGLFKIFEAVFIGEVGSAHKAANTTFALRAKLCVRNCTGSLFCTGYLRYLHAFCSDIQSFAYMGWVKFRNPNNRKCMADLCRPDQVLRI